MRSSVALFCTETMASSKSRLRCWALGQVSYMLGGIQDIPSYGECGGHAQAAARLRAHAVDGMHPMCTLCLSFKLQDTSSYKSPHHLQSSELTTSSALHMTYRTIHRSRSSVPRML